MERQRAGKRNMVAIKGRRAILVLLLFLFYGLLVYSALRDHKEVTQAEDLHRLYFGYPVAVVRQDQSRLSPPTYPFTTRLLSPWEYPTDILWLRIISIAGCVYLLSRFGKFFGQKTK